VYGGVQTLPEFRIVVVVASQGGLTACRSIFAALRTPLPAPLVLLQHRTPGSRLADVLSYHCHRRVAELTAGQLLEPGQLYLAPAHAVTRVQEPGTVSVEPLEPGGRHLRPGDDLLASAARTFGAGVIAVVLSGRLDDGAAGVRQVKRHGGRVLVQDPATAEQAGMPAAALATGQADLSLPPEVIAPALLTFLTVPGAAELFRTRAPAWAAGVGPQPLLT
jgi:two-component system chemotaxis response regulator CheB